MKNIENEINSLIRVICSKNREDPQELKEINYLFQKSCELLTKNTPLQKPLLGISDEISYNVNFYVKVIGLALKHFKFRLCSKLLKEYYLLSPLENQNFILCKFYHSSLIMNYCVNKKGKELIKIIKKGINHIIIGIKVCLVKKELFSYLIHEGSVYYWNLIRPLVKNGSRKHLIESYQFIVDALNDINDSDLLWRIKNNIQLALCYVENSQIDQSNKLITKSIELNKKLNNEEIKFDLLQIESYAKKKIVGGNTLEKCLTRIVLMNLSNNETEKVKIFKEISKDFIGKDKEKSEFEILILAKLFLSILFVQNESLLTTEILTKIKENLNILKSSKIASTRILREYIIGILIIKEMKHQEKLTKKMLKTRLKALKFIDRAMMSASKIEDIHFGDIVHIGCTIIWNICLPLLQNNLRKYIRKFLYHCSTMLEELKSHDVNELKAKIYFEIANCDLHEDLLTLANLNVSNALNVDYYTSPENYKSYELIRPIDRYIVSFHHQLELKTNIYKSPETNEDEAYLLIEQARLSPDPNLCKTLLIRALTLLPAPDENAVWDDEIIPDPQFMVKQQKKVAKKEKIDEESTKKKTHEDHEFKLAKKRIELYSSIVKIAWRNNNKFIDIVRKVACCIFAKNDKIRFDVTKDIEIFISKALTYRVLFESYIKELFNEDLNIGEKLGEDDPEGIEMINKCSPMILKYMRKFIRMGLYCRQSWIVLNGCTCVWNYHLSLFQNEQRFFQYKEILKTCFNALKMMEGNKGAFQYTTDQIVLSRVMYAYSISLLQNFAIKKYNIDVNGLEFTAENILSGIYKKEKGKHNQDSEELQEGYKACDFAIPLLKPMIGKHIISLKMKFLRLISDKVPTVSPSYNEVQKLLCSCEILKQINSENENKKILNDCLNILSNKIEISIHQEIFYILSQHAINYKQFNTAYKISTLLDKQLPEYGFDYSVYQPKNDVTERCWRWFCLTKYNCAVGIANLVDPASQNRRTQINLRVKSLEMFVHSMRFARFSKDTQLTLLVAQSCEPVINKLMEFESVRRNLVEYLKKLISDSTTFIPKEKYDSDVFEKLYSYLFISLRDNKEYKMGIKMMESALKHLYLFFKV